MRADRPGLNHVKAREVSRRPSRSHRLRGGRAPGIGYATDDIDAASMEPVDERARLSGRSRAVGKAPAPDADHGLAALSGVHRRSREAELALDAVHPVVLQITDEIAAVGVRVTRDVVHDVEAATVLLGRNA